MVEDEFVVELLEVTAPEVKLFVDVVGAKEALTLLLLFSLFFGS